LLDTHLSAERRYDGLRRLALELAQEQAPPGIRFDTITPQARAIAESWFSAADRRVDWRWAATYEIFRFRHPKRFEVSVWEKGDLTGLSMGRPTYAGGHLRLDFIEARPVSLGLKTPVFPEVELAYTVYAKLLNAKQIRITSPINDTVRSYYERFGYRYVSRGDYLFKEVV
jgi:hypothetical protein